MEPAKRGHSGDTGTHTAGGAGWIPDPQGIGWGDRGHPQTSKPKFVSLPVRPQGKEELLRAAQGLLGLLVPRPGTASARARGHSLCHLPGQGGHRLAWGLGAHARTRVHTSACLWVHTHLYMGTRSPGHRGFTHQHYKAFSPLWGRHCPPTLAPGTPFPPAWAGGEVWGGRLAWQAWIIPSPPS